MYNTIESQWSTLVELYNVSEDTLKIITNINGYNEQTMLDVLYAVAWERNF